MIGYPPRKDGAWVKVNNGVLVDIAYGFKNAINRT